MRPKRGVLIRTWQRQHPPVAVLMELTNGEGGAIQYQGICYLDCRMMFKAPLEYFPNGIDTVLIMPVRP